MTRDEVKDLEEVCEAALADVLATYWDNPIPAAVQHLMAKAAVTALEAHLVAARQQRATRRGTRR